MSVRADVALVEAGLAPSRSKARELIEHGFVLYMGKTVKKASEAIADPEQMTVTGEVYPFVSRGGLKLEKALQAFPVDTVDKVCADIGASTGGFCDCLLQHGAAYVYAVDCGHDQLAEKLLRDVRIENREGTNARYMEKQDFPKNIDMVTCDASFISLTLLLPAMVNICRPGGDLICLIKPQFEAGKEALNKKGVVRDKKVHEQVIHRILDFCRELDVHACGITYSPIKGPEGNTEYLLWLKKEPADPSHGLDIHACVAQAAEA